MKQLSDIDRLGIQQKKEWGEILIGLEGRNKYEITDSTGRSTFFAAEVGTSFLSRMLLQSLRPFSMQLVDQAGRPVLQLERPFRFFFHELRVQEPDGTLIGVVTRRFSVVRRLYTLSILTGAVTLELFGPILHPWTFEVRQNGRVIGQIAKKWSGLAKEMFSDADNFGIEFPAKAPPSVKAVVLGAAFLIDFVHFERRSNN